MVKPIEETKVYESVDFNNEGSPLVDDTSGTVDKEVRKKIV